MTSQTYKKPLPHPDEDTRDYWEGLRRGEIVLKRCNKCGYFIHYPAPVCRQCQSWDIGNAKVSGVVSSIRSL